RALFNLFPAPLVQAKFVYQGDDWRVVALGPMPLGEVPASHYDFMLNAAREYFARRRQPRARRESSRYDLAILVNDDEKEPPSNARALKKFETAAEDLGFSVEFIDK